MSRTPVVRWSFALPSGSASEATFSAVIPVAFGSSLERLAS